jgi:PAS domain S-box-containing protein
VARVETTARRRDGSTVHLESHLAVLRDADGRIVGRVGVSRDVTAARQAREAVARSEAQLRLIASRIPAGVFVSDAAGRNTFVNEGAASLAGLSVDEMMGDGYARVVHPDDLAAVAAQAAEVRAGLRERIAQDLRFQRPDGRERWVHLVGMPLASGDAPGWIGVLIDLTEERRLSERAARAERLAGLGALAGGMAHRVNNPLAALLASIRFALQEVRAGGGERLAEAAEALREAEEDGRRIAGIVKDLESFASPAAAGGVHDVRDVLHEAIRIAGPDLAARARLVEDLRPVPLVHGERSDLRQLFLHLLRNAWRAIPEGRPDRHRVWVTAGTDERGWALVEVRDDGAGMSASAARHAFEPFHGDRLDGSGGLGLSVCWGIATSLGGAIELDSREGAGTTVRVSLPPSAAAGPG